MNRPHRFLLLERGDRILLLRALFWVVLVRIGLWVFPFRHFREWLLHFGKLDSQASQSDPERIAWAVKTSSRYVPRATCLTQALVTRLLLSQNGYHPELRIGVALRDQGKLEAHAWVEYQGRVLIGETEAGRYTPLPDFD